MKIKKLIIKGFKSFANKTTIDFNHGVTAVVGPNGSGKSNIIEAIRWVMGEQSAKSLRGGRMNDVIFSGTEKRHALNLASVEMIMDNEDHFLPLQFEEVSIMRQITRSGDSGYYINHQPCRLKDIVDLFLDSGLGRESFSIISQGQVEAIFTAKPEERRAIIEEVAGVHKYKVRKEEAERKLEKTQDNLDRVKDIMYELQNQLTPLKNQARKAKKYMELRDQLQDLDIALTVTQITELKEKIDQDQMSLQAINNDRDSAKDELSASEKSREQIDQTIDQLENQRDKLRNEYLQLSQNLERQTGQLDLLNERQQNKTQSKNDLQENLKSYDERLSQIYKRSEKLRSEKERIAEKESALSHEIEISDQKLIENDASLQEEIDRLQNEYIDSLQQGTSFKNEHQHLEQEINREEHTQEKLKSEKEETERSLNDLQTDYLEKSQEQTQLQNEIDELLDEYQHQETEMQAHAKYLSDHQKEKEQLASELNRQEARASSLADMQASYSGYYGGVQAIMKRQKKMPGIIGTVADLISVPESYIQAIDTALGSSSQFIVVDHEKTAEQAIRYLRENRSGRATFLPISVIKKRSVAPAIRQQIQELSGFVGVATELVEYEDSVAHVIENLLGNIIVAETIEQANRIAKAVQYKLRIVTLDGEVIHPGGSMTGGRGQKNSTSPIFTQKKALQDTKQRIEKIKKSLSEVSKQVLQAQSTYQSAQGRLENMQKLGEEKRVAEQQIENELARLSEKKENQTKTLQAANYELSQNTEYINDLYEQFNQAKRTWQESMGKSTRLKAKIDQLQESQNLTSSEKEELRHDLQMKREKNQNYRDQLATLKSEYKHLQEEDKNIHRLMDEAKQKLKQLDEENLEEQIQMLTQEVDKLCQQKSQKNQEQKSIQSQYEQARLDHKDSQQATDRFRSQLESLTQQASQIEVRLSRYGVQIDHHLNYLSEEYQTSYEAVYTTIQAEQLTSESKKVVKDLKESISAMGTVNLDAIDEYKELSERWEFLTQQQNDLIEAKDQLYETMDQMDEEVASRFKAMFDQVKKQFSLVFPQMFGGGRAELQLTDPDNLLETGIEIIAQPPGKKLSRLSLLSGGERALTAISLLFAIIQVRPIPFCILDEVESALDDANVARFGAYLKHFNTDTQFIVITHRKGTMEEADRLYGVTMQEKGVSKLVSVSLEEAEEMEDVK